MWSAVSRAFAGLMALIYIGVGVLLIVAGARFENLPPFAQQLLAVVLIIYGLFRVYRLLMDIKSDFTIKKDDSYEEDDGTS